QGIREVSSSTRQGQATVTIEFELDRNIDVALREVETKISQAQRNLPRDIDPPVVTKVNPEDNPIMWIGVSGDIPVRDLTTYVQDHLKDQFQTVNGVGEIFLGGFVERNLRVWLDADKLEAYQLTVTDVINAIQHEHAEMPAGRLETTTSELNVRTMGEASSPEEFGKIIIAHRGGGPIYRALYLEDVATIEDGLADVRRISRTMGKSAIGLGVRKQRGSNAVAVARLVRKRVAELQRQTPPGVHLDVLNDTTRFIEDSVKELTFTLFLSALLTALVCWVFLGSWSATLNVLLAIPTSVVGAFIFLGFMGFTLNTFTLLGLSLAIGIVVDDAIMVLENIVRYREKGMEQVEAARVGARQITFAAIAATLAILAIFLPVAFMQGIIGKFFFQFGVTMTVAVSLSLLEALTLAPMRCAQFLKVGERRTALGKAVEGGFRGLADRYRRVLEWSLAHRVLVLTGSIVIFVGSLAILPRLRKEFVPPQDQSMFLCRLQAPVG
ncbi:MAG: efflux RND transporter permease subunit, partial [Candidatus Omnitrophica bacterium]|nr:efflux RND transporter permease subunit [Candidatus Omnitrophota bacterium]